MQSFDPCRVMLGVGRYSVVIDELFDCFCGYSHWGIENRDRHVVSLVSAAFDVTPVWVSGDPPDRVSLVTEHTASVVATGVSAVLDLRGASSKLSSWDTDVFAASAVEYHRLPIEDASMAFSDSSEGFRNWLTQVVALTPVPVLVHCHMGVNRSASVAALLLSLRGVPAFDAVSAVLTSRPSAMAIYAPSLFEAVYGPTAASEAARALEMLRDGDPRYARARDF